MRLIFMEDHRHLLLFFHILRHFPKRNNHIFFITGKAMVAERENAFLEVFDLSKKAMV